MGLFRETITPSSSDHLTSGEYRKGNEDHESKEDLEGEILNIEMTPEEAEEVYEAKSQLKMKAEENIENVRLRKVIYKQNHNMDNKDSDDSEDSKDDLASKNEIKFLKIMMPGMIYKVVFKDLDNKIIRTHVMSNVLLKSKIDNNVEKYVYDDFDEKAINLLREFADAQTLQELVDLKNALGGKDAYLVGGSQDKGGAEASIEEIERMKEEIAMLRAKTEGIDEGRPAGMSN